MRRTVLMLVTLYLVTTLVVANVEAQPENGPDLSPNEIMKGLRAQMEEVSTIRVNYVVNANYNTNYGAAKRTAEHKVNYLRDGKKFNIEEISNIEVLDDSGTIQLEVQHHVAYNGDYLKTYEYRPSARTTKHGAVDDSDDWAEQNDILPFVGFSTVLHGIDKSMFEYQHVGNEVISGRQCQKILQIGPYKPGHKAYTYYWIEIDGQKYRLMKYNTFIDNNPGAMLFEKRFKYNASDAYPFPREVEYDQYDIDKSGNRKLEYTKHIKIGDLFVNDDVDKNEFDFEFPQGTFVQDFVIDTSYVVGRIDDIDDRILGLLYNKNNVLESDIQVINSSEPNDSVASSVKEEYIKSIGSIGELQASPRNFRYIVYWLMFYVGLSVFVLALVLPLIRKKWRNS